MYKQRNISFHELIKISNWSVKSYTITEKDEFASWPTYSEVMKHLPEWLNQLNSFNPNHEDISFLILHEGSEGVFTLLNTWVGNNMLQTHIYLSQYETPTLFEKISGDGLAACVWELGIINHERNSWIKHILKHPDSPNYDSYLEDTINMSF